MELKEAFAEALRNMRLRKGLTQEDFGLVSSRTYISSLERGMKGVTLEKVTQLADRMEVHPLSVLVECFRVQSGDSLEELFETIRGQLTEAK